MKKLVIAAALLGFVSLARAEGTVPPLPFTEGTVWQISFVKVKPGFEEDYLKSLGQTWKKVFDEAKKQKLVVSYKIISSPASTHDDWDLMLMVEFKNMAVFDKSLDELDKQNSTIFGSPVKSNQAAVSRETIRILRGGFLAREMKFK